jgi:release factor glutamine methyltransferase
MYDPDEDSLLMVDTLRKMKLRGERALDMGTGSGVIAKELARTFTKVVACDIDPAVKKVKFPENVEAVVSDLFEKVEGRFDLIIFNPPYLPCPCGEDRELCCGDGRLIEKFVREAKPRLNPSGLILLLLSSLSPVRPDGEVVSRHKTGFEELFVLKIT